MTGKTANKLLSVEEYLNYDRGTDSHYELLLPLKLDALIYFKPHMSSSDS